MKVNEIMTRSVRTVSPDTPLLEVVSLMCLWRISGVPVEEDGKLVGMISEKDVLHYLFPKLEDTMESLASIDYDKMMGKYKDVLNLKVEELMTRGVISVSPNMHILKATSVMVGRRFRRIPVVEGDVLLGMVSLGDIHKAIYYANLAVDKK